MILLAAHFLKSLIYDTVGLAEDIMVFRLPPPSPRSRKIELRQFSHDLATSLLTKPTLLNERYKKIGLEKVAMMVSSK